MSYPQGIGMLEILKGFIIAITEETKSEYITPSRSVHELEGIKDYNSIRFWTTDGKEIYPHQLKMCIYVDAQEPSQDDKDEALKEAACNGDLDEVKRLVTIGADIMSEGYWAVRVATLHEHFHVTEYLLELGSDLHWDNDITLRTARDDFNNPAVVDYLEELFAKEDPFVSLLSKLSKDGLLNIYSNEENKGYIQFNIKTLTFREILKSIITPEIVEMAIECEYVETEGLIGLIAENGFSEFRNYCVENLEYPAEIPMNLDVCDLIFEYTNEESKRLFGIDLVAKRDGVSAYSTTELNESSSSLYKEYRLIGMACDENQDNDHIECFEDKDVAIKALEFIRENGFYVSDKRDSTKEKHIFEKGITKVILDVEVWNHGEHVRFEDAEHTPVELGRM